MDNTSSIPALLLPALLCSVAPSHSVAQARLYLDLKLGINYNFAEGAYFGKGERPFKARHLGLDEQGVVMPRLQVNEDFGVSFGYSGSTLGWGYSLEVPTQYTNNPFHGERRAHTTGVYMHQFPLLFNRTIRRYNIKEIDSERHLYLASFQLDVVGGGGLNRMGRSAHGGRVSSGFGLYDNIEFEQTIMERRQWGGFLIGGLTARFYRLGKERLHLSVYYTQGLTDMLLVPVAYRYNTQQGATTLHVRGSGLSATLGVPLRLKTFRVAAPNR